MRYESDTVFYAFLPSGILVHYIRDVFVFSYYTISLYDVLENIIIRHLQDDAVVVLSLIHI